MRATYYTIELNIVRAGFEPTPHALSMRANLLHYRTILYSLYGNRTRDTALKGLCLNHLTNRPKKAPFGAQSGDD